MADRNRCRSSRIIIPIKSSIHWAPQIDISIQINTRRDYRAGTRPRALPLDVLACRQGSPARLGVIDSRPKSEYARDAAQDLVSNYGFKKLSVRDPFAAPIGSVLVYGTSRSVGHVEIRTKDGFVSDFRSPTPSHRPLIGVYAKL
jgi:hypothetical protein